MRKEQLTRELNSVRLSDEQKEQMIQQTIYGHKRKQSSWGYRLVLPSFVVMAIFFVMLSQTSQAPNMTTAGEAVLEVTHEKWFDETLILFAVNVFLIVTAIGLSIRLLFVIERWQHIPRVIRVKQILREHKRLWKLHVVAFILSIFTYPFWFGMPFFIVGEFLSINNAIGIAAIALLLSAMVVTSYLLLIYILVAVRIDLVTWKDVVRWQVYTIGAVYIGLLMFAIPFMGSNPFAWLINLLCLLITLNICLLITFELRNVKQPTCPHCQHIFTATQSRKKIYMSFRIKCDNCQKQIYLTKKARMSTSIFSFLAPFLLILLPNIFKPSFITMIIIFIGFFCYFVFYYAPRVAEFETDEEEIKPLW
ncbi:TIGR04104 family putative zinc finger protein [Lysinibacillus sp. KU-BSD001]|uniref:TIGR04104 family putative zinc finger protein n=1 Tax=Lysinibacillus sp. KU-BSD001 TaxID=3141328 RepID=UPI0036E59D47